MTGARAQGRFSVVILAAQRAGVVNPLAQRAGVSHKCLAPICGRPLIAHVLDAVTAAQGIGAIRISIEREAFAELDVVLAPWRAAGARIDLVESRPGIADSVTAAVEGLDWPVLITTADNVLLNQAGINATVAAMGEADAVAALATEESIKAAHPDGQRKFYQFRDGGWSNCNLYGLASARALRAAEIFREGGQFAKNPKRLVNAFGLFNILLMRWKLVTMESAMKRVSRRFGMTVRAVVLPDGASAIDVDNERTYAIAEGILQGRLDAARA